MPRRKQRYLRDRLSERRNRDRKRYSMDYRNDNAKYYSRNDYARGRDRYYPEEDYMDYEQSRQYDRNYDYLRDYDMRNDYNRYDRRNDYRRGRDRDYRDYADDEYEKEYYEDLKKWITKLKKDDSFGLSMEQVIKKAEDMNVKFNEFDEKEFYAVYLMQISDYPFLANEPNTYLAMAKAWLEDKDLDIEPSEKVCKYLYEIVMADED